MPTSLVETDVAYILNRFPTREARVRFAETCVAGAGGAMREHYLNVQRIVNAWPTQRESEGRTVQCVRTENRRCYCEDCV